MATVTINVPNDKDWVEFQVLCKRKGVSASSEIVKFMQGAINDET